MANLSVRGVEEEALRRLERAAKRRGISLNRLITEMLNAGSPVPVKSGPVELHDLGPPGGHLERAGGEGLRARHHLVPADR